MISARYLKKMNAEEAKAFLKDRGIPTMNVNGYLLKVSRREGSPSRRIKMDEAGNDPRIRQS